MGRHICLFHGHIENPPPNPNIPQQGSYFQAWDINRILTQKSPCTNRSCIRAVRASRQPRQYKDCAKSSADEWQFCSGESGAIKIPCECRYKNAQEFTHMRYTAATCRSFEFEEGNARNFRQQFSGRVTELFMVLTMYNVIVRYISNQGADRSS